MCLYSIVISVSMGLVGSGTNNARLAGMLRNLAQFYHKEPQDLFMVRIAQVTPMKVTSLRTDIILSSLGPDSPGKGYAHPQPLPL